MSFNLTILVKCIVICLCAGLIGFKLGYSSRPRPAGLIEIGKDNTGEIMTTFKLEHGADWIAQQDIIQFKVYNPDNLIPEPSDEQNK